METKIVCRAIILDTHKKILLGKRVRGGGIGKWALIGGLPENGETPEQAIIREVREELNINFKPKLFAKYDDQVSTDRAVNEIHPWEVFVFSGSFEGEIKFRLEEISEIAFVSEDLLSGYDIAFNHKEILEDFFKH